MLTTDKYDEDDYEGITELVESVNIQTSTGPTEASRAVRKKVSRAETSSSEAAWTHTACEWEDKALGSHSPCPTPRIEALATLADTTDAHMCAHDLERT